MNQATLKGGEFPVIRGVPREAVLCRLGDPCTLGCLVREGGLGPLEEEVLSEGLAVAFSEEITNPCREPIHPRALDDPKLPFWGFLSSWCLAQRTGQKSCQTLTAIRPGGGRQAGSCAFALSWGGDQQEDGTEKRKCHPPCSQDCGEQVAWGWPLGWPVRGGKAWAPVIQQIQECSPHRQDGFWAT